MSPDVRQFSCVKLTVWNMNMLSVNHYIQWLSQEIQVVWVETPLNSAFMTSQKILCNLWVPLLVLFTAVNELTLSPSEYACVTDNHLDGRRGLQSRPGVSMLSLWFGPTGRDSRYLPAPRRSHHHVCHLLITPDPLHPPQPSPFCTLLQEASLCPLLWSHFMHNAIVLNCAAYNTTIQVIKHITTWV